ncbi:uncharacterized protein LOC659636 isoform X2 [Tribolium castaneum]|uniref:uncharacterized protein LOC659636 isoform X2 n=1 Tax=Tribolium castaneum TaxID=7070 RepID=UPI00077DA16C|nr:PREDICTED: uncharacterized protein LOC659636 isoform X2 [Tribolium castaneum]|eukprot:XP_015833470.1 PREDICTED: uncharacterized protein LOC659636 isoform X2 [Tribolium castaneum]
MLCLRLPKIKVAKCPYLPKFVCSIMSGDSPNAFTNENVFDFKEGRSSPAPTTSKEHNQGGVVTASVLVEPQKEKSKDKDKEEEDEPDFSTPTLNPGDKENRRQSDADKTLDLNDPKYDGDKGKEEQNLLNGGLDRLPKPYASSKELGEEESEDDTCIVNCIYYTMECCKCSIV